MLYHMECDHVPTIQDVEKELGVGIQSMRPPVQIIPEGVMKFTLVEWYY